MKCYASQGAHCAVPLHLDTIVQLGIVNDAGNQNLLFM